MRTLTLLALVLIGIQTQASNRLFCKEDFGKPIYFISADRQTVYTLFQGKRSQPVSVIHASTHTFQGRLDRNSKTELITERSFTLANSTVLTIMTPAAHPGSDGTGALKDEFTGQTLKSFFLCGDTAD